jgi:paraquat-inducible protein B
VKTKASPSLVGLFVLGALLLGLLALTTFGGINLFSRPQRFEVFFDESVHGLDLGSAVKLRGVRVGRVVDIHLRYDAARHHSSIAVVCELNRNMITDAHGVMIDLSTPGELQKLVDNGLRAQLGIAGLATGLLFVELDFLDPAQFPLPRSPETVDTPYAVVPSVPSTISEFQASLTSILTALQKVDFAGLSQELSGLLVDTRQKLAALDLPPLVTEATQAAQAVRQLASDPAWPATLANLNGAVTELRGTVAKIDTQVGPTADKLNEALAQTKQAVEAFNATALTVREFITAQQGLGAEADVALKRLAEASESVRRLADFLERNPAAILTGRKPADEPSLVPAPPPPPASGPTLRKP